MPALRTPIKTSEMPEQLWTVEDVALFLRREKKYVYKLIELGIIPYIELPSLGDGTRPRYAFDPIRIYEWVKGFEKMTGREREGQSEEDEGQEIE